MPEWAAKNSSRRSRTSSKNKTVASSEYLCIIETPSQYSLSGYWSSLRCGGNLQDIFGSGIFDKNYVLSKSDFAEHLSDRIVDHKICV